jgi:hypothetical protein
VRNADIIYDVRGGIQLPRDASFNPRALPLTPHWPGLLADVLIWALPCWLVLLAASRGVAAWRVRRGRCAGCGYARAGLPRDRPCPECGAPPPFPAGA